MSEPLISIVTPSFQQAAFLKVCVASVEMQGYPQVEHLVLDGGSTDGSAEYLAASPGCVTWWRSHPDGGQTQALNDGFARVTGEWIGWQNSDDFYYPGVFWRVAQIAAQYPEIQVIAGDTAIVDAHGVTTSCNGIAPVPPRLWLRGYWPPYNQSLFIRRDLLRQVIPLDEALHLHMDVELCLKMAVLEPKIAYLNQPLGAFRKYEGIKTDSATWREQSLREQAALRERFQQPIWPGAGFGKLRFRLRHHAAALRRWGVSAIMQRLFNAFERKTLMRVVIND